MTTKKDLVEAHAFSRRRLVTAFLSGAPGGREVEPTRPGRTIVGGVSIAVLLIAGAAIASVLAPRAPTDWNSQGVVVTDQGARYIVTQDNGRLRPIINLTSAQLILGLDLQTQVVSQQTVDAAKEPPGDPIGIEGAPESLPTSSNFIETGWTACTRDGDGVAVTISRQPQVTPLSGQDGFVVQANGTTWLIAEAPDSEGNLEAFRYQVPNVRGQLLQNIFGGQPTPATVPESWIELFPQGTALGAAGFPAPGPRAPMQGDDGANLVAGDIVRNAEGDYYLIRSDGWINLTPFAAQVYLSTPGHGGALPALKTVSSVPGQQSSQSLPATSWPRDVLSPPSRPEMCTQLHAASGQAPTVRIASTTPGSNAWPETPPTAQGAPVQSVDPGMGAFVRSGDFGSSDGTTPFMVDSRGGAYELAGGATITSLHLASYDAAIVPDTWIKVLGQGLPLSTEQALCPPATRPGGSGTCAPMPS